MENPIKDHPKVIALPPMILIFFFILSLSIHVVFPIPFFLPQFMRWTGMVLALLGIGLVIWTVATLKRAHTNINPYKPVLHFVVSGPFGLSRNPIYLGFLFTFWGVCLFAKVTWGSVFMVPLFLTLHYGVVLKEEEYLKEKFSSEFESYTKKIRRWI